MRVVTFFMFLALGHAMFKKERLLGFSGPSAVLRHSEKVKTFCGKS